MLQSIRHIVVIWDESEHVSERHLESLSATFFKHYVAAFPEGATTPESPMVMATKSPILAHLQIDSFLHRGAFIPHSGENKDLALVKYCSTGVVDRDERFHFLLDDLRNDRYKKGDTPLLADKAVLVCFITSDRSRGMARAIDYVQCKTHHVKTNFASLKIPKLPSRNNERIAFVGQAVGTELRRCFVRFQGDVLILDLNRDRGA